ncbi:MAG TPA: hypothetical protein VK249_23500 [Anaerolineales bacterium]|nr:hypothetical protein [Anaerolineales bacterium]
MERVILDPGDLRNAANNLCEKALDDAKSQLHPLLQNIELDRLDQRGEFLQAFKSALEQRIARRLALWQPGIQAVFKYEETRTENMENWDGSIHLLVKVPRLSSAVKALGRRLDKSLVRYLKQLGWKRFRSRQSILEVQQVTPNELRHAIGYGALFCAVYTAPVKVWPHN